METRSQRAIWRANVPRRSSLARMGTCRRACSRLAFRSAGAHGAAWRCSSSASAATFMRRHAHPAARCFGLRTTPRRPPPEATAARPAAQARVWQRCGSAHQKHECTTPASTRLATVTAPSSSARSCSCCRTTRCNDWASSRTRAALACCVFAPAAAAIPSAGATASRTSTARRRSPRQWSMPLAQQQSAQQHQGGAGHRHQRRGPVAARCSDAMPVSHCWAGQELAVWAAASLPCCQAWRRWPVVATCTESSAWVAACASASAAGGHIGEKVVWFMESPSSVGESQDDRQRRAAGRPRS